ncbi:MAG: hypothetical protein M1524_01560 [Patescibacteria group bacterium]|nr:hypothetical protein [Patescibacteria group bacterium]
MIPQESDRRGVSLVVGEPQKDCKLVPLRVGIVDVMQGYEDSDPEVRSGNCVVTNTDFAQGKENHEPFFAMRYPYHNVPINELPLRAFATNGTALAIIDTDSKQIAMMPYNEYPYMEKLVCEPQVVSEGRRKYWTFNGGMEDAMAQFAWSKYTFVRAHPCANLQSKPKESEPVDRGFVVYESEEKLTLCQVNDIIDGRQQK